MVAGAESPKRKQEVAFSTGWRTTSSPRRGEKEGTGGKVCCGRAVDSKVDGALEFTCGALLEGVAFGTPGKICPRDPPPVLFMCQVCGSFVQMKASGQTCWGRVAETPVACTRTREECLLASSKGDEDLRVSSLSVCSRGVGGWAGWEGEGPWESRVGKKRGKRIIGICWGIIVRVDQEVQGDEERRRSGVGSSTQCSRLRKT